ncbi:MAG TPA: hypothetical protein VGA05_08360 [Candidatus Bathyarchaeia archaeon]
MKINRWIVGGLFFGLLSGLALAQVNRSVQMSQDPTGFIAADLVAGHLHIPQGGKGTPVLSACGAATATGNDAAFTLTAAQATCTATFATVYPAAPRCLISGGPTTGGLVASSTTALTITGLTAASVYTVFCIGQ